MYVTEHRKRDHFRQKVKTELLVPPYSSYLGLWNDASWEARSATTTKIQDAKLAPHGSSMFIEFEGEKASKHLLPETT